MSNIYVFGPNETENDYASMGLVGALVPSECVFNEEANGESILNMTHPLDEYGRHKYLQRGNILVVPVPVRTTPEIQNGSCVTTVWKYQVKPLNQLTSTSQRTLYKKITGSSRMKVMNAGDILTVVQKPEEPDSRWKAKTEYGTGWINPLGVTLITEYAITDDSSAIEEIQSPWTITNQYFRIYELSKSLRDITVTARHIRYDLLKNLTRYSSEDAVPLQTALDGILNGCYAPHDFEAYTNVLNEQGGIFSKRKNPIDAFLNPEEGICKQFNVGLVSDNYSLYFLTDPGINRGVIVEYSKNLLGITFASSDDDVITRIVPVGETKNGDDLLINSEDPATVTRPTIKKGSTGAHVLVLQQWLIQLGYNTIADSTFGTLTDSATKLYQKNKGLVSDGIVGRLTWATITRDIDPQPTGQYVDSPNIDLYPIIHVSELKCENCTVGDKDPNGGGTITTAIALARMQQQALDLFASKCDEPKIDMTIEFVNLGDTVEYSKFKNLEDCFLFDYIIVRHPDLDIDITAQITSITWDCLLERMREVTIGNPERHNPTSLMASWQVPYGITGSKVAKNSIRSASLADEAVSVRHMQIDSISTEVLQAECVTADKIQAGVGGQLDLSANNTVVSLTNDSATITSALVHLRSSDMILEFLDPNDPDTVLLQMIANGLVGFKELFADKIVSPSVVSVTNGYSLATPNPKGITDDLRYIKGQVTLTMNKDYDGSFYIENLVGGCLVLDLGGFSIKGFVVIRNCSTYIVLRNGILVDNRTGTVGTWGSTLVADQGTRVFFDNLKIDTRSVRSNGILLALGSSSYIKNCDIVRANVGIYVDSGAETSVLHCRGTVGQYGLMTIFGGFAKIAGTVPEGNIYDYYSGGTANPGHIIGTADGLVTAQSTTASSASTVSSFVATNIASFRGEGSDGEARWRYIGTRYHQGEWLDQGEYTGCMWWDLAAIRAAIGTSTVQSATITMHRYSGAGNAGELPVVLRGLNNAAPSGDLSRDDTKNYGEIGTWAWVNNTKTVTIPVAAINDLKAIGGINGLCIYDADASYLYFDTKPTLTIAYM